MDVSIDTSKIGILQDFFNDLSQVNQRKIFMSSFRKAAKPLIEAAKGNIHDGKDRYQQKGYKHYGGSLRRSIGSIERPEFVSIIVGARLAGPPNRKGWHGMFTEEGTKERFRRRQSTKKWKNVIQRGANAGRSTGHVTAQHWFERAWDVTSEAMYDSMAGEWYNEIDRFIIRVNKKLK